MAQQQPPPPLSPHSSRAVRSQAEFGRSAIPCCIVPIPCCERRPPGICCRSPSEASASLPCERPPPKPGDDALNTEFIYFSAALRQAVPELDDSRKRRLTIVWLRKLFSPEYHCPSLRDKRNRYLMALAGALLAGAAPSGLLARPPPLGPIPEMRPPPSGVPASWQRLDPWSAAPGSVGAGGAAEGRGAAGGDATPCQLHGPAGEPCPAVDARTSALLDDEFRLFTWLARPRARALPDPKERAAANAWARALAVIGPDACPMLKGMRNDYALALVAQLHDGQLRGPLEAAPSPGEPLLPLAEAARRYATTHAEVNGEGDFCDLTAPTVQQFVRAQPRLDNGAFCYVLVNP